MGFQSITVDTNGYLFHDFLNRVEPGEVDVISFSMDGATRKTNDAIRGGGCYDKCLAGIEQAKARGFSVSMIYTVSRDNIHELEMMVPLLERLRIHRFFIQVIGLRGKSAEQDKGGRYVSRSEWMNTVPPTARKIAELGIPVVYPKVYLEPGESFECAGVCADNYFIFPNGRVYRCPVCEDYSLHSLEFEENRLLETGRINEKDLFTLNIPEGCVMNKLVQPANLSYDEKGNPEYQVACCMLKEEIS